MAKYRKGIQGPVAGKFGNIIASSWREVDYFKSVSKRRPKKPSEKQLANRLKFKLVQEFLASVNRSVQLAFISDPGKRTGRNAAHSYILNNACILTDTGWKLDYSKVLISFGVLSPVKDATVKVIPNGIRITWNGKEANKEQMIIFLIDPQEEEWFEIVAEVNRSAGEYILDLSDTKAPFNFHVYIGTVSIDRKQASNSLYLGKVQYPAP